MLENKSSVLGVAGHVARNVMLGFQQKFLAQSADRILEPAMVMNVDDQLKQYAEGGESGGLAIAYELIIHKFQQIAPEKGQALDICSASGVLLSKLAAMRKDVQFTGIDLAPLALQLGRKRVQSQGLTNVDFKEWDMRRLDSFPEKDFDLITWNLAMHHCDSTDEVVGVINGALKLLKKNGVLFICDVERAKTRDLAVRLSEEMKPYVGDILYEDTLNSYLAAFTFGEFAQILGRTHWQGYEHFHPALGNFFQFACTKVQHKHPQVSRNTRGKTPLALKIDTFLVKNMMLGKM
ncbi:MAG: class I SAM-dependent methyltransferase [Candidatus Omnitrophica bacterium]|nr:class I SAM-dependent methyltransferase [Candidatus Omnitrophota bacterium]